MSTQRLLGWFGVLYLLTACATPTPQVTKVEAPVSREAQQSAQKSVSAPAKKGYKRKVAVARFTNETRYGRSLLRDADLDPLGKQASDMLSRRLVESDKFLVFERPDLEKVVREQERFGGENQLVGVDTLIVGSVTEFGRFNGGKKGFLSSTKNQVARAKVEVRLVDVTTGQAFFSATGNGEANTESGEVAGFGSRADYDATLNDRAIGAAVSDLLNSLVSKLEEKPWRTDILKVDNQKEVIIAGGKDQGLRVGDILAVMRSGKKVKSIQSGLTITLPPDEVATIRVIRLFGSSETDQGAICELTSGSIPTGNREEFFVTEIVEKKI